MIYVYTAILNGFDNLRPPLVEAVPGVRYVCFTNLPNLPRVDPWEFRPVYQLAEASRTSRVPKILPHLMLPADAEYSIWHDGNFQLRTQPAEIVASLLSQHDWAAHQHPARSCIYREADVLLREGIGTRELVLDEIERYRLIGYPENHGLWANGLLVRRHSAATIATCERWWKLFVTGCERDQLSFPVAREAQGLAVNPIEGHIYESPCVAFGFHAAWHDKYPNREYWSERARVRTTLAELEALAGPGAGIKYPSY